MEITYGAEVLDKNGNTVGKIDYLIRNTYTGELSKFRVKTELAEKDYLFSPEDVLEATTDKVKLKIAFNGENNKANVKQ